MTTPSKARMIPTPDPTLHTCHIDESAGMDPAANGNAPEPVYGHRDDHTADQCRFETCESCGCCAHGKAHVIGCSTEDAPVGFACPNDDCGCTGQGRSHAARTATPTAPEVTPAIERAGRAIWEHDNGHTTWPPRDPLEIGPAQDAARAGLAAGLVVEEIAKALQASERWTGDTGRTWDEIPERWRETYRIDARYLRTALLGEHA